MAESRKRGSPVGAKTRIPTSVNVMKFEKQIANAPVTKLNALYNISNY